jgi:hypothetical protein
VHVGSGNRDVAERRRLELADVARLAGFLVEAQIGIGIGEPSVEVVETVAFTTFRLVKGSASPGNDAAKSSP